MGFARQNKHRANITKLAKLIKGPFAVLISISSPSPSQSIAAWLQEKDRKEARTYIVSRRYNQNALGISNALIVISNKSVYTIYREKPTP